MSHNHSGEGILYPASSGLISREEAAHVLCKVEGCERPRHGWGWCRHHYNMWKRNGDPMVRVNIEGATLEERLLFGLPERPSDPDACWEWKRSRQAKGYGYLSYNKKGMRAHRVAYEVFKGPIPAGKVVRHTCNNPPCCNPEHLLVGSYKDNSEDMTRAGRSGRGEKQGHARLTEADVLSIRREYAQGGASQKALAERHGVSTSTIDHVIARRTWKWLEEPSEDR